MLNKYLPVFFLAFSGLLITTVSAFFSVQGFLLFIPDPHLMIGILGLGVAFELAKITGSTFLFHRMSDGNFPILFKVLLTLSVLALVLFSVIFTFVHLNSSASKSLATTDVSSVKILQLKERNTSIEKTISDFELQISSMPSNMVTAKTKLYDKFTPEKLKLQKELASNMEEIHTLQDSSVASDQFVFLSNLSSFTGIEREKIFIVVIMFIVCIIDPLAISLFLAASYILSSQKPKEEISKEVVESLPDPKPLEVIEVPKNFNLLLETHDNSNYSKSTLPSNIDSKLHLPTKPAPEVIIEYITIEKPMEVIKEVTVEKIVEVTKEVYIEPPVKEVEHINQFDHDLIMDEYSAKFLYVPKKKEAVVEVPLPELPDDYLESIDNSEDEELDSAIDRILDGENPLGHRRKKIIVKK